MCSGTWLLPAFILDFMPLAGVGLLIFGILPQDCFIFKSDAVAFDPVPQLCRLFR